MNTDICVLNQTNNVKYLFSRNICYLELLLFNNVFLTSNFIANSIINDVHAYVYTGELVALHITYKFTTVRDYIHISDSTIHFESYNYDDIITKVYIRILNIVTHRHLLIQTMHLLLLYNMLYLSISHWHDQWHASYDLYLSLTDRCNYIIMATISNDIGSLPFSHVNDRIMASIVDDNHNQVEHITSSNNDILAEIDPDVQIIKSAIMNQCKQCNFTEINNAFTNQQNISMIHLNIRSSQKNLMDFVCNLDNLIVKFDFIILSETWGTDDKAKLNVIPGYNHIYDTREKRNGGGISMYVNDHTAYKKRIDLKLNKKYFESCFIEVDKTIFQTKHNVIIGGLYKPPNISIDIFNENLEVILNTIGKERKNAFLIGDYNINTLDELSCKSKQR